VEAISCLLLALPPIAADFCLYFGKIACLTSSWKITWKIYEVKPRFLPPASFGRRQEGEASLQRRKFASPLPSAGGRGWKIYFVNPRFRRRSILLLPSAGIVDFLRLGRFTSRKISFVANFLHDSVGEASLRLRKSSKKE